ncbi:MAG: hydrogen peroxide-dependent heme synthase [Myxococcota bacterium]
MTEHLETLEGWYSLHDFRTFDWASWGRLSRPEQQSIHEDFMMVWKRYDAFNQDKTGAFGFYEILGHKADFLILNLRSDTHVLSEAEHLFQQTKLAGFMKPAYSYVSVVELSNYVHSTGNKSPEAEAMIAARLKPVLPKSAHVCFYPMSKRRGEKENWYSESLEERRRMMRDHGMTGRGYAGKVVQMIGGSIGLDDWEWGVTLFAEDPLVFKHIVTDMRFDEVSARFGEFGAFYVGNRLGPDRFHCLMLG